MDEPGDLVVALAPFAVRPSFGQPANISSRRRCISSWERDSMSWETIQTWPNGSSMRPGTIPVELVVHGDEHLRSRPLRRLHRRVRILDLEREPHRRSAERARLCGAELGVVLRHHDGGIPDPEFGMDDAPVGAGEPGAGLDRPEGIAV